jgi:hypothetical protein
VKLADFGGEIEFEKRTRQRRCVRTTVSGFLSSGTGHYQTSVAVMTNDCGGRTPPSLSHRETSIAAGPDGDRSGASAESLGGVRDLAIMPTRG